MTMILMNFLINKYNDYLNFMNNHQIDKSIRSIIGNFISW